MTIGFTHIKITFEYGLGKLILFILINHNVTYNQFVITDELPIVWINNIANNDVIILCSRTIEN